MSERRVPSPTEPTPLLKHLVVALQPMNRTRVKQLLQHGQVLVNGVATTQHDHPVGPNDRISISNAPMSREPAIAILHEDDSLIAVEKPCGLLTVATESEKEDTAFVRLQKQLESRNAGRPYVVHRLDRETSGVLLFARSPAVRDELQAKWDSVEKLYLAVVEGTPKPPTGTIENHLVEGGNLRVKIGRPGGSAKLAITHYKLLATHGRCSLLEVKLGTGRKHQIRVHLASLGCPVIGDAVYGSRIDPARRLGLHAWRIALPHPIGGKPLVIESPYPAALNKVVRFHLSPGSAGEGATETPQPPPHPPC
jgi:23S rRNA pseudouridine1911/1915/1917 synthase